MNTILNTDALSFFLQQPEKSINCIVTSPPYFGLRAYGTTPFSWPDIEYSVLGFPVHVPAMTCELGQETTHWAFIGHLILIFRAGRQALRDDGTLWLNIADSYAGYHGNKNNPGAMAPSNKPGYLEDMRESTANRNGLKAKDLIGIPWMLAFALRDDGWYLRQDIIWHKPNPMPESVTDRCTKSHEYFFLLSKSERYYFDHAAIKTKLAASSVQRLSQDVESQQGSDRVPGKTNGKMKAVGGVIGGKKHKNLDLENTHSFHETRSRDGKEWESDGSANKRSVWTVTTKPFKDAHFATYPQDLIIDPIKAGCPEGGLVADPFMGSGTTAVVARKLNRNYIGSELNPKYHAMAESRILSELGMFA
jgi:DNA modification methylase